MVTQVDYDMVIIGGGLAGASLASALHGHGLRIAVVEASPFDAADQPSFDTRTVALAYGSRVIFEALGLWEEITQGGVTPIQHIHISDRKHSGIAHLDSETQAVEALGYVVETRVLGRVLGQHISQCSDIDYLCPARLSSVEFATSTAHVLLQHEGQERRLTTHLVVAADGGQSLVRQQTGIKTLQANYGQTAIIANVVSDKPHHNVAYERFTDSGPMALLPTMHPEHADSMYALVWTVRNAQCEELMALSDEAFLNRLQQRFGSRAGRFLKASQRFAYPLSVMLAKEHVRHRLAIIGNAAHTIHPVAGQGFNLGLRDVASLAQVLVNGLQQGDDLGDVQLLKTYAKWRRKDHLQTMAVTDGLVRLFSSRFPPLILARNLGLLALDVMPSIKQVVARQAMGYVGRLSRLARGLPL